MPTTSTKTRRVRFASRRAKVLATAHINDTPPALSEHRVIAAVMVGGPLIPLAAGIAMIVAYGIGGAQ